LHVKINHYWTQLFHPKLELQSLCHKTKQKQTNKQTKTYSYWFDVNDILSQEQNKKKSLM